MIYIGYQGVGKSSISGKNNCIDLESGNFWVEGERVECWYKIYCNIAEHLSKQGYLVFMSSHKVVREELNKRNVEFIVITPCLELKEKWIERLQNRYNDSKIEKDYKALANAQNCYEENIKDLLKEDKKIVIKAIDYSLINLIKESREDL